ncbi:MAG: hypothetical protein KBB23_07740 [Smithella sp.]|nr:hypothetical protein [Smithella sp.]
MNFLESLVAEWYEYNGCFVRSNPRTRKRPNGGYDVELDVLAYAPSDRRLIHIETSGDANSWQERKERFLKKKFILSNEEYENLIGSKINAIERVAIVGWGATKTDLNWGVGIRVQLIPDLIEEITLKLRKTSPLKEAVPESFPLLRSMQMALAFGIKDHTTSR